MNDTSLLILTHHPDQRSDLVDAAKRVGFSVIARPPMANATKSAAAYGIVVYDWSDGLSESCAAEVKKFLQAPDRDAVAVALIYPPSASGSCELFKKLDDIVFPPYDPDEVIERLLRLAERREQQNVIEGQDVTVDLDGHQVTVNDERVAFTFTEFRVLSHLLARRGRVVTKDELCRAVWGESALNREALDVHVRRVRGKLKAAGVTPVETVRKVGYRYVK